MSINVLIIDDSPVMRAFMKRVVSLSGVETGTIFEAGNGAAALELLYDQHVDLILTDINMPVMNGEEFMTRLKQDDALQRIPVIVVSTDARSERLEQMLGLGASGYITKPFQPEDLRAEIQRVMAAVHA